MVCPVEDVQGTHIRWLWREEHAPEADEYVKDVLRKYIEKEVKGPWDRAFWWIAARRTAEEQAVT